MGGCSLFPCSSFSLQRLFLLHNTGSRRTGLSSCGPWVARQYVESSWTRDRNLIPFTGTQTPIHCITREVLLLACHEIPTLCLYVSNSLLNSEHKLLAKGLYSNIDSLPHCLVPSLPGYAQVLPPGQVHLTTSLLSTSFPWCLSW